VNHPRSVNNRRDAEKANYMAAGTEPVVLDGGRRITGWKQHDAQLWVTDLPEVAHGQWGLRQLYVNGHQRTRNNQITDNSLHHYGLDYPSAVGVLLMNTQGNTVAYNHIHSPFPVCRPALRCPGRGRFQA
jgi:hypothetical protein